MDRIERLDEIERGDIVRECSREWFLIAANVVNTPGVTRVNFKQIYHPDTPDEGVRFGYWWFTSDPNSPYFHLFNEQLELERVNPRRFRSWKYGSYVDCKVHRVREAVKLERCEDSLVAV